MKIEIGTFFLIIFNSLKSEFKNQKGVKISNSKYHRITS